jgi:acyl-CoA thioesterase-2
MPGYGARVTTFSTPADELPPAGVRLLDVLGLERLDRDLFRSTVVFAETWSLFGGQVAAQALLAAGRTVDAARLPHSLHGYFLRPGDSRRPVVFAVERDRDGGSFSARRVVALQEGEVILNLSASFALPDDAAEDETRATAPTVAGVPAGATTQVPPRLIGFEQWVPEQPHPLHSHPTHAWFRCTEPVPDDPVLDAAVLTYLSDIFTGHGSLPSSAGKAMSTIDHAVWLHRPARAGEWVLMALHSRSVSRGRGYYTGELWAPEGRLVASLAQETLYRACRPRPA